MAFDLKSNKRRLVDGVHICNCSKCNRSGNPLSIMGLGYWGILVVFDEPNDIQWTHRSWFADGNLTVFGILCDLLGIHMQDMFNNIWAVGVMACHCYSENKVNYEVCSGMLSDAIKRLRPTLIISVGERATGAVLRQYNPSHFEPNYTTSGYIGECIPLNQNKYGDFGCWLVPIHSDSEIRELYGSNNAMISMDRKFAFNQIDRGLFKSKKCRPNYVSEPNINIEFNSDVIVDVLEEASNAPYTAFDYETNCFQPELPKAKVLTSSIAYPVGNDLKTVSFPMSSKKVEDAWVKFLLSDSRKIGANITFEERWSMVHYNTLVRNWYWDVCIGGRILNCAKGSAGLKRLTFVYFGVVGYDDSVDAYMKGGNNEYNMLEKSPMMDLLTYNAYDSYFTYKCFQNQLKVLK